MVVVLLVGVGGFGGSVSRYLIGRWVNQILGNPSFPYGTLTVNVIGCLFIGFLVGLAETRQVLNPETRGLLLVGFLGGFTTFSAFGYETFSLARDGQSLAAFSNVALQIAVGLGAVWLGYSLSRVV